jgi:hypothetical protein
MSDTTKPDPRIWAFGRAELIAIVAWLVYAGLTLAAPADPSAAFDLSSSQMLLLKLTIIVPVLVIWLIVAHGAGTLKRYTGLIQGGSEYPAINGIAIGVAWAAVYLIALGLPGALIPYFRNSSSISDIVATQNYLPLVLSAVAFVMLYLGSRRLAALAKFDTWTPGSLLVGLIYLIFAAGLTILFSVHPDLVGENVTTSLTHYESRAMLVFTLILPYLVVWFLGVVACINIIKYSRHIKGTIYRGALGNLVVGILGVVAFGIVLQLLQLYSPALTGYGLGVILLILYGIIVLYGLGFGFIASGSRKLIRIEAAE